MKVEKIAIINGRGLWQGFEADLTQPRLASVPRSDNSRDAEVRYRFVLGKNDFAQLDGEFSIVMPGNGLTCEQIRLLAANAIWGELHPYTGK